MEQSGVGNNGLVSPNANNAIFLDFQSEDASRMKIINIALVLNFD
jgi:hypothetical protein